MENVACAGVEGTFDAKKTMRARVEARRRLTDAVGTC